jgi:hypothetical protein
VWIWCARAAFCGGMDTSAGTSCICQQHATRASWMRPAAGSSVSTTRSCTGICVHARGTRSGGVNCKDTWPGHRLIYVAYSTRLSTAAVGSLDTIANAHVVRLECDGGTGGALHCLQLPLRVVCATAPNGQRHGPCCLQDEGGVSSGRYRTSLCVVPLPESILAPPVTGN